MSSKKKKKLQPVTQVKLKASSFGVKQFQVMVEFPLNRLL